MWRTIKDTPAGVTGPYEQHYNAHDKQFHLKAHPLSSLGNFIDFHLHS